MYSGIILKHICYDNKLSSVASNVEMVWFLLIFGLHYVLFIAWVNEVLGIEHLCVIIYQSIYEAWISFADMFRNFCDVAECLCLSQFPCFFTRSLHHYGKRWGSVILPNKTDPSMFSINITCFIKTIWWGFELVYKRLTHLIFL